MKVILYIRSAKPGRITMDARLEEEPNYDTPRVSALSREIHKSIDNIIDECAARGFVEYGKYQKLRTGGVSRAEANHETGNAKPGPGRRA